MHVSPSSSREAEAPPVHPPPYATPLPTPLLPAFHSGHQPHVPSITATVRRYTRPATDITRHVCRYDHCPVHSRDEPQQPACGSLEQRSQERPQRPRRRTSQVGSASREGDGVTRSGWQPDAAHSSRGGRGTHVQEMAQWRRAATRSKRRQAAASGPVRQSVFPRRRGCRDGERSGSATAAAAAGDAATHPPSGAP